MEVRICDTDIVRSTTLGAVAKQAYYTTRDAADVTADALC
jgi:hypothetical protein